MKLSRNILFRLEETLDTPFVTVDGLEVVSNAAGERVIHSRECGIFSKSDFYAKRVDLPDCVDDPTIRRGFYPLVQDC